jgi:hypothetical protein
MKEVISFLFVGMALSGSVALILKRYVAKAMKANYAEVARLRRLYVGDLGAGMLPTTPRFRRAGRCGTFFNFCQSDLSPNYWALYSHHLTKFYSKNTPMACLGVEEERLKT